MLASIVSHLYPVIKTEQKKREPSGVNIEISFVSHLVLIAKNNLSTNKHSEKISRSASSGATKITWKFVRNLEKSRNFVSSQKYESCGLWSFLIREPYFLFSI